MAYEKLPRTSNSITRGDTEGIEFTVRAPDGITPRNISGDTLRFSAKQFIEQETPVITKVSTTAGHFNIDDAGQGHGYVMILPADTAALTDAGDLICDLEVTDSGGNKSTTKFLVPFVLDVTV